MLYSLLQHISHIITFIGTGSLVNLACVAGCMFSNHILPNKLLINKPITQIGVRNLVATNIVYLLTYLHMLNQHDAWKPAELPVYVTATQVVTGGNCRCSESRDTADVTRPRDI